MCRLGGARSEAAMRGAEPGRQAMSVRLRADYIVF